MVTLRQESTLSKYTTPSLEVVQLNTDVIKVSGVVAWEQSWGTTFEQTRETTWLGVEE